MHLSRYMCNYNCPVCDGQEGIKEAGGRPKLSNLKSTFIRLNTEVMEMTAGLSPFSFEYNL